MNLLVPLVSGADATGINSETPKYVRGRRALTRPESITKTLVNQATSTTGLLSDPVWASVLQKLNGAVKTGKLAKAKVTAQYLLGLIDDSLGISDSSSFSQSRQSLLAKTLDQGTNVNVMEEENLQDERDNDDNKISEHDKTVSKLRATLMNKETQQEKLKELLKSAVSTNAFAKAMKLKSQMDGLSKEISSIHDTLQNLSNNNSSEDDDDNNVEVQPITDEERLVLYKKSFDKALVEHDFVQAQKVKDKIDEIKGFLTNETRSE